MLSIALFELRRALWRLSTWIYFLVFFALAGLALSAAAGAFPGVNVVFGGKSFANSPQTLMSISSVLGLCALLVAGGVMGQAVYQDFAHGTHTLFFTAPISRARYLGGRFLGAFLTMLIVLSSIGLGLWVTSLMPWNQPERLGPQRLAHYLWPYVINLLPNLLFAGSIFFSLAALTRRILPVYISSVVLFLGYLLATNLLGNLDSRTLATLLDPFGLLAFMRTTEYWTLDERNTRLAPLTGALLANRLLWLALGGAILAYTFARFQRTHSLSLSRSEPTAEPPAAAPAAMPEQVAQDFRSLTWLRLLPGLVALHLKATVRSPAFITLVLAGVLFMLIGATSLGSIYGTTVYPVTYMVLELVGGSFMLFHFIIGTVYAGELVWREREAGLHQLTDTLPVPTWLPFLSKLLTLVGLQVALTAVVALCSLLVQAAHGYFHFELRQYALELFGIRLVTLVLMSVLALFIHTVVDNKYVGHFIMVIYLLASRFSAQFGLEDHLYKFASAPRYSYSDMNGYEPYVQQVVWFRVYWGLVALALALATHLLWVRGTESGGRWRLLQARARASLGARAALGLSLAGALAAGAFIFYNTHHLNPFRTQAEQKALRADYEKRFKHFEQRPHPRITSVQVEVELYPGEQRLRARGTYGLLNKTQEPVREVLVNLSEEAEVRQLTVAGASTPSSKDEELGVWLFQLPEPLPPGARAELRFDLELRRRGFSNGEPWTELAPNGAFLDEVGILPNLGYRRELELVEDEERREQGLEKRPRMAALEDEQARYNNALSRDADWIDFEATVSTEADQVALAPGYLQREWTEGSRRYFHYKMDTPILKFFSFISGRYTVRKDTWRDVAIEIYHHPTHTYNVDRMVEGVKAALDYYTSAFGPYQHRQVRIIEFPRYRSFAQSFPNTIPFSEALGFIARVEEGDPEDVDYPFFITAHEVAHQWWGHQVVPANAQGASLVVESLAEYSALMVLKRRYGAEHMGRFLRYELDKYLQGRAFERMQEQPLLRVENQPYIHYSKGGSVLYMLADYMGEDTVNRALAAFLKETALQPPPYPTSLKLLEHLRAVTPEHLQYLLRDSLERIVLYENRALEATARRTEDGRYEVKLSARSRKLEATGTGQESELPLEDWVEVGVLDDKGQPLYLQKHRLDKPEVELTVVVEQKPKRAGLDPLHKLIDRMPEDNTVLVQGL